MSKTNTYTEWADSQEPAIKLLEKLGYTPLSPDEALAQRGNSESRILLVDILEERLRAINRISYKGQTHLFSDENIYAAIEALRSVSDASLIQSNEKIFELLTLGKSLEQSIEGDRKSFTLKYIDWENPGNNTFHLVPEFQVFGRRERRRPDIVLFVNGIPFVVIECKRRDKNFTIDQAINQLRKYQTPDEGIPRLFYYAQLLMAIHPNEVKYGTVGTDNRYWAIWREETDLDPHIQKLLTDPATGNARIPTEQDRCIYALCRPERLMELTFNFILYDAGIKKIARYNQYFAVKKILNRVNERTSGQNRKGGVIWHTQGSGKSLTMVLLAKSLIGDKDIPNPRVVIVTDRIDLDDQIWKTFSNTGKEPIKAKTGKDLIKLLQDRNNQVITTIIDKFDATVKQQSETIPDRDIFVLIDESHRSQYGFMHVRMKKFLPNACYLGFTGTPLLKNEKSTAKKFGGIIDAYPMEKAVKDGAVLRLLYEGRMVTGEVHKKPLDKGFDRIAEPLNEYQRKDLKKKFSTEEKVANTQQFIEEIAYDIQKHYCSTWQGTGAKAQLAASSKLNAIRFHNIFEQEGKIRSAVIISAPDKREGEGDDLEEKDVVLQHFWKRMMDKYGTETEYNKSITESFKSEEGIEVLIVVDKLLTGFDAPRNTVLYIHKKMQEHSLLQAIARVNRPFKDKDFGYIIDYRGILEHLDQALTTYGALAAFEEEDLKGTIENVNIEVDALPQRHAAVWDVFKPVKNKKDIEELERFLAPQDIRDDFYEKLRIFLKTFQIALSNNDFIEKTGNAKINEYKNDAKFFVSLRQSVRQRYYEIIKYSEYEKRIQKLIDTHIIADEVQQVVKPVDIFDPDALKKQVEEFAKSDAAKADAIAHRLKRIFNERMDEDPALYKKFSKMISDAIEAFQQKRVSEAGHLNNVNNIQDQFQDATERKLPEPLAHQPEGRPYFNSLKEEIEKYGGIEMNDAAVVHIAEAGVRCYEIIDKLKIIDWQHNPDIPKQMENELEDFLISLRNEYGINLDFDQIDRLLSELIHIARSRD